MEQTRGLSSLSATADAVTDAAVRRDFEGSNTISLIRFFQGLVKKAPRVVSIQPGPRNRGNIGRSSNAVFETLLTPTEARRRYGIVVDRPVPVRYARWKSQLLREEWSDRAILRRSNSPLNELKSFLMGNAVDQVEDTAIKRLFRRIGNWPAFAATVAVEIAQNYSSIVEAVEDFELFMSRRNRRMPKPVVRPSGSEAALTRSLESLSPNERSQLLAGYAAALAEGQLPQHDQILLLMRLLDQDNEVNRRPPNAGIDNHVRPSRAD